MKEITELEELLDKLPEKLKASAGKAEQEIYEDLVFQIGKLDFNKTGLAPTSENVRKLAKLKLRLQGIILNDDYKKAVDEFVEDWSKAEGLINKYMSSQFENFAIPSLIKEYKKQSVLLTQESLLDAGINAYVVDPLNEVLLQSVTGNATFKDTLNSVSAIIRGDKNLGRLQRYVSQISTDAVQQYVANYTYIISNDLDVEFYMYRGSKQDTTRPFCMSRYGKYYSKKEIIEWGKLGAWDGKIPGTNSSNIFINRGGYNCKHIIVPVSEASVPEDVIKRQI
jgi:hypothetical protein